MKNSTSLIGNQINWADSEGFGKNEIEENADAPLCAAVSHLHGSIMGFCSAE